MKRPDSPKEWKDPANTLFRKFDFTSTADIECLIRLVKEHIPDQGNSAYLRNRLLGILWSKYSYANRRFWLRHYHPRTWKLRVWWKDLKDVYHVTFKTKYFKNQVYACNLVDEIIKEE